MNFDFAFYLKLILRRLPAMAALFLFCAGLGIALAIKLPTTYSSSSRLLVEGAQIPDQMLAGTVNTGTAEQLEIIQQRLMTRANLIDIANKLKVFENISSMSPDTVVAQMRQRTTIRRARGRDAAPTMTITFEAGDPQIAANVVNEYVTLILDANVRFRTGRAEGTFDFFEQEVTRLSAELDTQTQKIVEFKNANVDALPDGQEYRFSRQALLQERLGRAERDKASLLDQRARIVAVFEATGRLQAPETARLTPQEEELRKLEAELSNALLLYSETNPRVRILQTRIAQLEETVRASSGASAGEDPENTQQSLLDLNLAEIDARAESFDLEIAETKAELAELREAIRKTPQNGIALGALERDLANLRSLYDGAVNRLAQASMGERIEVASKGQRISVIEPANVPNAPSSPNRPLIATAGIGSGLLAAGGLFVLLELLNKAVRRPADITARLGIAPLAVIPFMESTTRRRTRRVLQIGAVVAVVVGVPAALWAIDTYYLPLDLLFNRLLSRIGLA